MISIVFVLLAFFEVFPEKAQPAILFTSMSLALVSVALVDIVFPLIDNAARFKEENKTQFVGIALFCVAYLAQFFIDLDKNKKNQIEEEEDEELLEDEVGEDEEFDNSYDDEEDNK